METQQTYTIMSSEFTPAEFVADVDRRITNLPDTSYDHGPAFQAEVIADMIGDWITAEAVPHESDESDAWCSVHERMATIVGLINQVDDLVSQANAIAYEAWGEIGGLREKHYPHIPEAPYTGGD